MSGEEYVGKSKSPEAFKRRKAAHNRKGGKKYLFDILEEGIPDPQDLAKAEEDWIRAGGGPGSLENKRFEMNDERYKKAGGCVGKQ